MTHSGKTVVIAQMNHWLLKNASPTPTQFEALQRCLAARACHQQSFGWKGAWHPFLNFDTPSQQGRALDQAFLTQEDVTLDLPAISRHNHTLSVFLFVGGALSMLCLASCLWSTFNSVSEEPDIAARVVRTRQALIVWGVCSLGMLGLYGLGMFIDQSGCIFAATLFLHPLMAVSAAARSCGTPDEEDVETVRANMERGMLVEERAQLVHAIDTNGDHNKTPPPAKSRARRL